MSREVQWSKYIHLLGQDGSNMTDPANSTVDTRIEVPMTGTFEERYAVAKAALAKGKPFRWTLDFGWHDIPWGQPPPLGKEGFTAECEIHRKACRNYVIQPSGETVRAAAKFRDILGLESRRYVTLHVRRTDAHQACDTAVEKVASYVFCSLANGGNKSFDPIVLFTDETDPIYLKALHDKLSEAFGGLREVIHGDFVLDDIMGKEATDRFMGGPLLEFFTSLLLRFESSVELMMDRTRCLACETALEPKLLCKGKCDFTRYVSEEQLHTSPWADKVGVATRLKMSFDPACTQQSFPTLDQVPPEPPSTRL